MQDSPRVLVTLATYNEADNLPALIEAIHQELPAAHILVVDDNSPDGTGAWCEERSQQDARIRCIHREGKLGFRSARPG